MPKRNVLRSMLAVLCCMSGWVGAANAATPFIVKDGQPHARFVVAAESRARMATLAAIELQRGIQKISGARLQIATAPDADVPVTIYVGASAATEAPLAMGVEGAKLSQAHAYRPM